MRQGFNETTGLDLHGFPDLDDQAILGHIDLYHLSISCLTMKSSFRVRPINLIALLISIESRSEAGEHADILVPPCPLPSEVRVARVIMNEATVYFWSVRHCLGEEVILKRREMKVHIPVEMLCKKKCRALHGC
jgi:hypothetical protein